MQGKETEATLNELQSLYQQYKQIEQGLQQNRIRLGNKLPEIKRALDTVKMLCEKTGSGEELDMNFELTDSVYAKAKVKDAESVYLWLGANVMLEYPLDEARELLETNYANCKKNLDTEPIGPRVRQGQRDHHRGEHRAGVQLGREEAEGGGGDGEERMSASRGNEGLGRLVDQDVVGTLAAGIGWVRRSATTITRLAPDDDDTWCGSTSDATALPRALFRARVTPRSRPSRCRAPSSSRARPPRRPPSRRAPVLASFAGRSYPASVASVSPRPPRGPARPAPSSRAVDPSEENAQTTASPNVSRRAALINLALFGVSVPLWRDVLHDLGYLHGAEDEPADLPYPRRAAATPSPPSRGGVSGAWSVPSTSSTASSPPPPDTAAATSQTRRTVKWARAARATARACRFCTTLREYRTRRC